MNLKKCFFFRDFRDKSGGSCFQFENGGQCFFLFRTEKVKVFYIRNDIFRIGTKHRVPVINNNKSPHLAGGFNAGSTSQLEGPYEGLYTQSEEKFPAILC